MTAIPSSSRCGAGILPASFTFPAETGIPKYDADVRIASSLARLYLARKEECVMRLCRRYLAALCPSTPQEIDNFLWSMGLRLVIEVSNAAPTRARIYRGAEVLDEEQVIPDPRLTPFYISPPNA